MPVGELIAAAVGLILIIIVAYGTRRKHCRHCGTYGK